MRRDLDTPGMFASPREALRVLGLVLLLSAWGWGAVILAWLWIERAP